MLSNNSASIPFNKPTNDLVIPVTDPKINSLNIIVKRGDAVLVANEIITESFLANPVIKLCDDRVVIRQNTDTTKLKIFLVKDFSSKLTEGPIQLEIYPDESEKDKQVYNLNVIWIGKPISLSDPEAAIKHIEIIESKDVVSDIFSMAAELMTKDYSIIGANKIQHLKQNSMS